MAKYIDADKLKTKVNKLNLVTKTYEEQVAFNNALAMVVEIITSLQQEQPEVDLAKEIEKYYYDNFAFISSAHTPTLEILRSIATHFCEIGQINAANKFDEIEYNRQRAEEESK